MQYLNKNNIEDVDCWDVTYYYVFIKKKNVVALFKQTFLLNQILVWEVPNGEPTSDPPHKHLVIFLPQGCSALF